MEESNEKNNKPSPNPKEEKKNNYGFVVRSAREVQEHERKTSNYIIENMITPGLNILAGPSKCGKSWLSLELALCIATGKQLWKRKTVEGRVLYMALEDNDDRMEERLNDTLKYEDAPEKLDFTYEVNGIKGIEEGLPKYFAVHKDTKLVIIDVLQKIRGNVSGGQTEYGHDYAEIGTLKELADSYGVAVLLVTHTRKTPDKANPTNQIAGGVGVVGVADTLIQFDNKQEMDKPRTLSIKGRDIMEQAIQIKFNKKTCLWDYVGTEDEILLHKAEKEYASSPVVKMIKALLDKNGGKWQGTCTDLLECGEKETGITIAMSNAALGRILRKFKPMFAAKDSIVHILPDKNGGVNGRIHQFYIDNSLSKDKSEPENSNQLEVLDNISDVERAS